MEPKVLADALVEAGIGKAHQIYPDALGRFYQIDLSQDWQSSVNEEKFITDWRVAGKVLESMDTTDIAVEDNGEWSVIMNGRNSAGWIKSLPRAIIEAWYAATEQGESE